MTDFKETLSSILQNSEFLQKTAKIKLSISNRGNSNVSTYRNLSGIETEQLKKQNNHAESWDNIFVADGFIPSFISNSRFYGKCYLGKFSGFPLEVENDTVLQSGIYDSIIKNSEINDESLICRCGLISNYIISSYTVLFNNGTITASGENTFSNGNNILIGPETGERGIKIFSEMDMNIAKNLLIRENKTAYNDFVNEYTSKCSLNSGYIGKNCRIINTTSICDSFLYDTTVISGASMISDSTILSSENDGTSAGTGVSIKD